MGFLLYSPLFAWPRGTFFILKFLSLYLHMYMYSLLKYVHVFSPIWVSVVVVFEPFMPISWCRISSDSSFTTCNSLITTLDFNASWCIYIYMYSLSDSMLPLAGLYSVAGLDSLTGTSERLSGSWEQHDHHWSSDRNIIKSSLHHRLEPGNKPSHLFRLFPCFTQTCVVL